MQKKIYFCKQTRNKAIKPNVSAHVNADLMQKLPEPQLHWNPHICLKKELFCHLLQPKWRKLLMGYDSVTPDHCSVGISWSKDTEYVSYVNSTIGFSCCKQYGAEIIELKRNYSYLGRWQLCCIERRLQVPSQAYALKNQDKNHWVWCRRDFWWRGSRSVSIIYRQGGWRRRPCLYGELCWVQAGWYESLFVLLSLRCIIQPPQLNKLLFVSCAVSHCGRARHPARGCHKAWQIVPFICSYSSSFSLN